MSNRMNGAEAMVRMLQAHDVKHVFGLCGDTSLPLYDASSSSITASPMCSPVTNAQRPTWPMPMPAVTGKVGVCEGPSGGGATYILPGLIEAGESSIPVLAITTDISVSTYGKFPLTEVDQEALMRP